MNQAPQINAYPETLDESIFWNHNLQEYSRRLKEERSRLLCDESDASIGVLQRDESGTNFVDKPIKTNEDLLGLLSKPVGHSAIPQYQHFFIKAKSSQAKLPLTESMLCALFSHFQVTPAFLDLLFTFSHPKDKQPQLSSFRAKELWTHEALGNPAITPTSFVFQLCYNLRSVERAKNPPKWPWSIRQTAVFHSCNISSGDTAWINIKASAEIAPRFRRLLKTSSASKNTSDLIGAFHSSLTTHLAYCEWAAENWGTYIGFLENQLRERTPFIFLATVSSSEQNEQPEQAPTRTETVPVPPPRSWSFAQAGKTGISKVRNLVAPKLNESRIHDVELGIHTTTNEGHEEYNDFSYDDLRRIQHIEDEANLTLLAIKSNINILGDLRDYYSNLQKCQEFSNTLGPRGGACVQRFMVQVSAFVSDLRLQQSRLETLLQLLVNRKGLLLQLFAHRNMAANRHFTTRADRSAAKMEKLTEHMNTIAMKTENETIFMRIITVVTLCFLPGTFVATLMSTDIVKFQNNGSLIHKFSWMALVVYLAITIPIMLLTVWIAFWYRKRAAGRAPEKKPAAVTVDVAQKS